MCVIYANYTSIPDLDELKRGEERNDDGAGVAWVQDGKVYWEKGLDAKGVHELLKGLPLPNVVHFRNATIGAAIPAMSHPFPLTPKVPLFLKGYADSVLVHNGTLHDWKKLVTEACYKANRKLPGGEWSDTRALAWLVANFGEGLLTTRETDLVTGQRIAILSSDGQLKRWGYSWPKDPEKGTGYFQSCPTGYKQPKTAGFTRHYGWPQSNTGTDLVGLVDAHKSYDYPEVTLVDGKVIRKVTHLGAGAAYFFDPAHEKKLAPLNPPEMIGTGTTSPTTLSLPRSPTVTIIKGVKKDPSAHELCTGGGQVIYTKQELERVMASLVAKQDRLALDRMKLLTFPKNAMSH